MDTRSTMMQIIPLAMHRVAELGITVTLDSLIYHVAGQDSLEACTDLELFALVRALNAYEAFRGVKATTPKNEKVVQLMTVTTRDILDLTDKELDWLLFRFGYFAEPRGLACAVEAGLLDAWLRLLRLWDASRFPGVDNLTASPARQAR